MAHFIPIGVAECRLMVKGNLWLRVMDQETRWLTKYKEVMDFMEANKRRPSKFVDEERGMRNWWKHQRKLVNAGELKEERMEKFKELIELGEKYKRVNQYA